MQTACERDKAENAQITNYERWSKLARSINRRDHALFFDIGGISLKQQRFGDHHLKRPTPAMPLN